MRKNALAGPRRGRCTGLMLLRLQRVLFRERWAQPKRLRDTELCHVIEVQSRLDLVSSTLHSMACGRMRRELDA